MAEMIHQFKKNINSILSFTAISGFVTFLVVTLFLPFTQSNYDTSERYVSELILGEYGWLLNLAIIGNLIGCISFTLVFYHFHRKYKSWICLISLCVATLSVLTNFFPTDIHGKAVTLSGHIHNIGAFIGTIAIFLVMILFPIQLKKMGLLQGIYNGLAILALFAPIFYLILLVIVSREPGVVGIFQRVFVLVIMLWLILASIRLKTINLP